LFIFFFVLFLPFGDLKADPMPLGYSQQSISKDGERPNDAGSMVTLKKQHGYLEYDGTGYRLVNKKIKPENAGYLRLKPVAPSKGDKGKTTMYTIEVLEDKGKEAPKAEKSAGESPRIAVMKVEELDKKGVGIEPYKGQKAEAGLGMKISESSEILMGRALVVEKNEGTNKMDARDDGWRFRFKTNF